MSKDYNEDLHEAYMDEEYFIDILLERIYSVNSFCAKHDKEALNAISNAIGVLKILDYFEEN